MLGGQLADRLQKAEPVARAANEAVRDERLERGRARAADRLGRVDRPAAPEHRSCREEGTRVVVEQPDAPVDRPAQRPLARWSVGSAADKQRQRAVESLEQLGRMEGAHAGGCELDREWKAIEPRADLRAPRRRP